MELVNDGKKWQTAAVKIKKKQKKRKIKTKKKTNKKTNKKEKTFWEY